MYRSVWDTDGSTVCFAYEAEPSGKIWSCMEEKESRKTKRNLKQEKEKEKKESER